MLSYAAAMVELTSELIVAPTENPPGNDYAQAVELLCQRLRELGFSDTHAEGDCVLSFVGDGERTLYFSGHYDDGAAIGVPYHVARGPSTVGSIQ